MAVCSTRTRAPGNLARYPVCVRAPPSASPSLVLPPCFHRPSYAIDLRCTAKRAKDLFELDSRQRDDHHFSKILLVNDFTSARAVALVCTIYYSIRPFKYSHSDDVARRFVSNKGNYLCLDSPRHILLSILIYVHTERVGLRMFFQTFIQDGRDWLTNESFVAFFFF